MQDYTTRELTPQEAESLTHDLQDVLKKHNCEMGVISSINLMKRVETVENKSEEVNEEIPSPYVINGDQIKEKTDTTPEESSEGSDGESTEK